MIPAPGTTIIPFVKASACGNDFLIVAGEHAPEDLAEFARRICNRHTGVGADGVEFLYPAANADAEARLRNADGSSAEISGNGTRCVAAYLVAKGSTERVVIQTGAGSKTCTLTGRVGESYEFETEMGVPLVGEELSLVLQKGVVRGVPVSMGNPHYVVFAEEMRDDWLEEASEIGRHRHFKDGVNVEIAVLEDKHNLSVRFFERGVGETKSSGTGSCASAVAAIATELASSPLRVHAAGGVQTVRWEHEVVLRGTADIVCRGEFFG